MDITALFKMSYGLYVVGVKNEDSFGGCIVDAMVQATSGEIPRVILCSMNGNNTRGLIQSAGEFTVSVLSEDVHPFVIANFGYQSSRDVEKWENVPHEIVDGLPLLNGAASYFRLRLEDVKLYDTHHVFTCTLADARQGRDVPPLLYGDYFKELKNECAKEFELFKSSGIAPASALRENSAVFETKENGGEEKWVCALCGYVYDGETPFEELPEDWRCPLCGAPKSAFEFKKA